MENIKDKMTTIAGFLGAIAFIGGAIVASIVSNGVVVPIYFIIIIGACGAASVAINGYYNGKTPDGKTKTPEQIKSANAPTGTVIKMIALLIGLSFMFSLANAQSTKYFFKSTKQIDMPITKKAALGDVTAPASAWFFKLDGGVNLTRFQYVGGVEGVKITAFQMAGLGVSYQKISVVDGQNYADLTLKFLIDFPTVDNQKMGICAGPGFWNNTISFVIGYTLDEKYPFLGINGSWNF